ncbi:MAG: O-antigen ligase family protein [Oscillospiraceae bacterium]|nr:O-antigen ligase family protein [Oscillospiraceae bacterium]
MDAINFVGLVLLTEYVIRWKPDFLLSGLLYLLLAEVFINFLTILLFPNGLYSTEYFSNNYFLGYDNQNINVLLPTLVLAITRYKYKLPYSRPILIVTLFLVLYTVLVIFSGASLVIVSLTMLLSLPFLCEMSTICNGWNYLIINVMMFFSIVIFRLQNLFSFIIVDMLGKDLTLTGRTFIWKRVNDFIKRNPILGYGVESQAYRSAKMKLKSYYGNQISSSLNSFAGLHAHNRFLETAYRGGVILTVIYCAILIISAKQLYKNKDAVIAKMMSIGMFVYLTGMLTEFYRYSYLFFPLLLMAECSAEIDGMIERKYGKMTNICSVLTFIQ